MLEVKTNRVLEFLHFSQGAVLEITTGYLDFFSLFFFFERVGTLLNTTLSPKQHAY